MITSESGNQYLKPDYLSPLPSSMDSKQSPLALLAQTCSQIGADTTPAPTKSTTQTPAPTKKTSPKPAFKPYELDEKRKSPRESPTRASPKYPQDYLKALYSPRACRDPYCHGCPAGLAQLAALAQPYVCSWVSGESTFCGKRFTTPEDLLQHLRSHTGEPRSSAAAALYPRYHPYPRLFPYLPPYYPPYLYPSRLPPL